jgi:hypothetical protein
MGTQKMAILQIITKKCLDGLASREGIRPAEKGGQGSHHSNCEIVQFILNKGGVGLHPTE